MRHEKVFGVLARLLSAGLGACFLFIGDAFATSVHGVIVMPDGQPAANYQINLENKVTGNIFLAATASDGSFSLDVPPGLYNLRERDGTILRSNISVHANPVDLGPTVLPAQKSFWSLFQRMRIAPAIVTSSAPVTAEFSNDREIPKANPPSSAGGSASSNSSATSAVSGNGVGSKVGLSYLPSVSSPSSGATSANQSTQAEAVPPPIMPSDLPSKTPLSQPGVQ